MPSVLEEGCHSYLPVQASLACHPSFPRRACSTRLVAVPPTHRPLPVWFVPTTVNNTPLAAADTRVSRRSLRPDPLHQSALIPGFRSVGLTLPAPVHDQLAPGSHV